MENSYNKKISEIEPINSQDVLNYGGTRGVIVKNREDLRKIIEEPCLAACLYLYDRNICTVNSTANKKNIGNKGEIVIDYDSLSEENKKIIEKLEIKVPYQNEISISVPISSNSTVGEISDLFMQKVLPFKMQDIKYGKVDLERVAENLLNLGLIELNQDGSIEEETIIEVEKQLEKDAPQFGYVYDEEENVFWETEEIMKKHKNYILNEKSKEGSKEK